MSKWTDEAKPCRVGTIQDDFGIIVEKFLYDLDSLNPGRTIGEAELGLMISTVIKICSFHYADPEGEHKEGNHYFDEI